MENIFSALNVIEIETLGWFTSTIATKQYIGEMDDNLDCHHELSGAAGARRAGATASVHIVPSLIID